jgi:hypothetical protein
MAPDDERDPTFNARLNARMESYKKEANDCFTKWKGSASGSTWIPTKITTGVYSGITHEREADYAATTLCGGGIGVNMSGNCSGCKTLDITVKAIWRDKKIYEARDFQ